MKTSVHRGQRCGRCRAGDGRAMMACLPGHRPPWPAVCVGGRWGPGNWSRATEGYESTVDRFILPGKTEGGFPEEMVFELGLKELSTGEGRREKHPEQTKQSQSLCWKKRGGAFWSRRHCLRHPPHSVELSRARMNPDPGKPEGGNSSDNALTF